MFNVLIQTMSISPQIIALFYAYFIISSQLYLPTTNYLPKYIIFIVLMLFE